MKQQVIFVGSYLSGKKGTKDVAEKLVDNIHHPDLTIRLVSTQENRLLRLLDIFVRLLFFKGNAIIVDVFSGMAFTIAMLSVFMAKLKSKHITLMLRGGALAEYTAANNNKVLRVLHMADQIQTPSKFLQQYFQELGFEVTYLPNPIDLQRFPYNRSAIKPNSILWVRAFTEIYQPQMAIEALRLVKQQIPEATLTMVGPDKGLLQQTKELIASYGLTDSVNIVGPVQNQDLHQYYQTHQVYINTTRYESFGMALMEAASCGIPIVTNAVGEIPFLWTHEKTAMLCASNTAEEMATNIVEIILHNQLENTLSLNASEFSKSFSWENLSDMWMLVLQKS